MLCAIMLCWQFAGTTSFCLKNWMCLALVVQFYFWNHVKQMFSGLAVLQYWHQFFQLIFFHCTQSYFFLCFFLFEEYFFACWVFWSLIHSATAKLLFITLNAFWWDLESDRCHSSITKCCWSTHSNSVAKFLMAGARYT